VVRGDPQDLPADGDPGRAVAGGGVGRRREDPGDEHRVGVASQVGGGGPRLPKWTRNWISPYQNFTRIYPTPTSNRIDEHDFFENVRVDEPVAT